MEKKRYFEPKPGGRWSVGLRVADVRYVALVQDSELFDPSDAEFVLRALQIPVTTANLDTYFPVREGRADAQRSISLSSSPRGLTRRTLRKGKRP